MQDTSVCFIIHDPNFLGSTGPCDIMLSFAKRFSATHKVTILYINGVTDKIYKRKVERFCDSNRMVYVDLVVENTFDMPYLRKASYRVFQAIERETYDYVVGYNYGGALFYSVAAKVSGVFLCNTELILFAYDSLAEAKQRSGGVIEEKHELEQLFMEEWHLEQNGPIVTFPKEIISNLLETTGEEITAKDKFQDCLHSKIYIENLSGNFSVEEIEKLEGLPYETELIINSSDIEKISDSFLKCQIVNLPARKFFEQAVNDNANIFLVNDDFNLSWIPDNCVLQIVQKSYDSSILHSRKKSHTFSGSSIEKAVADILTALHANIHTSFSQLVKLLGNPVSEIHNKDKVITPQPKVSVCMTHFNRPDLLRYAIEAIDNQTYSNFEVILVDDGSSQENYLEVLDFLESKFAENNWKILRQKNKYLGAARNFAAKNATGKYLLFMDDDNYALPHLIETLVSAAEYSGNEVVTCALQEFTGMSKPVSESEIIGYYLPLGSCLSLGTMENCFGDANALIKKTAFDAIGGFTEDYGIGYEDWELFVKLSLAGYAILPLPEVLFWYRTSEISMVRTTNQLLNQKRIFRVYQENCPPHLAPLLEFMFCQSLRLDEHRLISNRKVYAVLLKLDRLFDCLFPMTSRRRKYAMKFVRLIA